MMNSKLQQSTQLTKFFFYLRIYYRFTATWPKDVRKIAKDFIKNPIEIKFGDGNDLSTNKAITQIIKVVKESDKTEELKKVLQLINPNGMPNEQPKTIIFVSRKKECDNLGNQMWNAGFLVDSLHGDKEQHQRTKVMDAFKKSQTRVLVATDIAARGLDVKDIEVVINFDFPGAANGIEDYVHRIGRTGRAEAEGKAFTFFTAENGKSAHQLIGILEQSNQAVPEELRKLDRGVEVDKGVVVRNSWGGSGDSTGRGRGGGSGDSAGRGRGGGGGNGDSAIRGRGRGRGDSAGRGRGGGGGEESGDSAGRGRGGGSGDSTGRGRGGGSGDSTRSGGGGGSGDSAGRGRGRGSGDSAGRGRGGGSGDSAGRGRGGGGGSGDSAERGRGGGGGSGDSAGSGRGGGRGSSGGRGQARGR